ncbi:YjcQ family protein [Sporosarcina sp. FSL W7-1349]|uniref:YjcQ family protein n=1 Tax=Sporosarcina sp. FSL W7-1349 TaxID=2921561 RepID=UPI0030F8D8C0
MANETFDIVLAILQYLDESLDDEQINFSKINPDSLGVSEPRLNRVLEMMINSGYITGFHAVPQADKGYNTYHPINPRITLSGIYLLEHNRPTNKVYDLLKEIRDWIPGY